MDNNKLDSCEESVPGVTNNGVKRVKWSNKIEFLVSVTSGSIGLGNVWRFPYLCYVNGGGAFILPYFICVILGGVPIFFLEVSLGQLMSAGGLQVWNICPLMKGIGAATAIIRFYINVYYMVIMAWAFFYLFASFTSVLPWSHCNNSWNTQNCFVFHRDVDMSLNQSTYSNLSHRKMDEIHEKVNYNLSIDPVTEFWQNKVLQISDGIENIGTINWELALCLLLSWVILFLCISRGIKAAGKVMYITSTFPFLLLFILLIRGCTLPGAIDGVKFYLLPDFEKLKHFRVWADAGSQVFFSYSLCLGLLTAMGSYNKLNHNSYRDSLLFTVANSGTSLLSGFVIFTTLGYMAKQQGVSVASVAESGPGLAFIAYPHAVSQMPFSTLWSILFFLMILFLGMGSMIVGCEAFLTAVFDQFPNTLNASNCKWRKLAVYAIFTIICFFISLVMVTNGGMYIFLIFDFYAVSRFITLLGFLECVTIACLYGVNHYYNDLNLMLGFKIGPYMKFSWLFTAPLYTLFTFVVCVYSYRKIIYNRTYEYPDWAIAVGWIMATVPMIFIPTIAMMKIYKSKGNIIKRLKMSLQPAFKDDAQSMAEQLELLQKNRENDKNPHQRL